MRPDPPATTPFWIDQLAALQWVRANIAAFGGDANNITIMGQSAGAMSVQQLVLSPITRGLFSKAVMSSGGGVSQMLTAKPASPLPVLEAGHETAGCSTLAEFRALAPAQLFAAWDAVHIQPQFKGLGCEPVVDGRFQVKTGPETLAADEQHHIPYLIGFTSEDIVPPYLYQMAQDWCARNADSYGWFFDRQLPVMTVVPGIPATCGTGSARWLTAGGPSPKRTPPQRSDGGLPDQLCQD